MISPERYLHTVSLSGSRSEEGTYATSPYPFIILGTYTYQSWKKGPKRSQRLEVPRSFGHV